MTKLLLRPLATLTNWQARRLESHIRSLDTYMDAMSMVPGRPSFAQRQLQIDHLQAKHEALTGRRVAVDCDDRAA